MGASSNKNREPKNEEEIINKDLKKLLFLFIQQKKLKEIIFNNNISEGDEFYLVNESLDKLNINYNIENIFNYLNISSSNENMKHLSIKNIDEVFKVLLMKKYSGYEIDREKVGIKKKQKSYYELECNYCQEISFPVQFFLIQSEYFDDFIYVYDENQNKDNYNKNKYEGYIIKD